MCLPFGLSVIEFSTTAPFVTSGLIDQIISTGGGYPYLTVNAYNAWALVPGDTGNSLANAGLWVCDGPGGRRRSAGPGSRSFGAGPGGRRRDGSCSSRRSCSSSWSSPADPDRLTSCSGLAVLALAFFAVPTRVHERYGFPFFALGAILVAVSWRWRLGLRRPSVTTFLNMYVVLTTLYPTTRASIDWLGIGAAIRSPGRGRDHRDPATGSRSSGRSPSCGASARDASAASSTAAAAPPEAGAAASRDDGGDRRRPVADAPASAPTAGAAAGRRGPRRRRGRRRVATPMPRLVASDRPFRKPASSAGSAACSRARPIRADRSASPGRAKAAAGSTGSTCGSWSSSSSRRLGLRTFRLAEPYQMHFDEVYHARTATEFLQGWRYGLSTTSTNGPIRTSPSTRWPAGSCLWGEDDVSATSDLGTAGRGRGHRASPRGRRRRRPGRRAGPRRDRDGDPDLRPARRAQLIGTIAAPGRDRPGRRRDRERAGRRLRRRPDRDRRPERSASAGSSVGLTPAELGGVGHPVTQLLVTRRRATVVAASDDRLVDGRGRPAT